MKCQCRHEDCELVFDHNGSPNETTCCPSCGRQQHPLKATANVDITEVILNVLGDVPQDVREAFFAILRERWCMYCGNAGPTYKCYCQARGEDV